MCIDVSIFLYTHTMTKLSILWVSRCHLLKPQIKWSGNNPFLQLSLVRFLWFCNRNPPHSLCFFLAKWLSYFLTTYSSVKKGFHYVNNYIARRLFDVAFPIQNRNRFHRNIIKAVNYRRKKIKEAIKPCTLLSINANTFRNCLHLKHIQLGDHQQWEPLFK